MRPIDAEALEEAIKAQRVIDREINPNIATISYHNLDNIIDNTQTIIWCNQTSDGLPLMDIRVKPHGECKSCIYRDPEDKKCDCGGMERQGCIFSVSDDYYCKYYEKGGTE